MFSEGLEHVTEGRSIRSVLEHEYVYIPVEGIAVERGVEMERQVQIEEIAEVVVHAHCGIKLHDNGWNVDKLVTFTTIDAVRWYGC